MKDGWKRLESDLCRWLSTFACETVAHANANQALPGFPSDGFRSDGCLTDGRVLIAIEVEAGQVHPDTNVGKYWLLQQVHPYERLVLFHVFTPDFNSYQWRMCLSHFYAGKMRAEMPLEYVLLDRRLDSDYGATFEELKSLIGSRVAQEFSLRETSQERSQT